MKSVVIDFSGWVKVDPDSIEFEYVGEEDRPIIKGTEWIAQ